MLKLRIFALITLSFVLQTELIAKSPKNIIYMIGDGLGLAQVTMLMVDRDYNASEFDRAQNVVLVKNNSASHYITDSAASGTALATGYKTNNGMVGRTPDGVDRPSIITLAAGKGLSTGIVVTCELQHATPSAFYASADSRKDYKTITEQLVESPLDVAIGSGYQNFNPEQLDLLTERGYSIVKSLEEVEKSTNSRLYGILADKQMSSIIDGRDEEYLERATSKAIDILSQNRKGFVLMVEGSQIDWAGHNNDAKGMLAETKDFERAVKVALDFAQSNGETLVVITADHETGGMTLTNNGDKNHISNEVVCRFSTSYHSGVMVPAYLYGVGAEQINGVLDNTDFAKALMRSIRVYK